MCGSCYTLLTIALSITYAYFLISKPLKVSKATKIVNEFKNTTDPINFGGHDDFDVNSAGAKQKKTVKI